MDAAVWLLTIWFMYTEASPVVVGEFSTEKSCEIAAKRWMEKSPPPFKSGRQHAYVCLPMK